MKPKSIPFTKTAYQKMQSDLADLQTERKQILVRLQTAREMGDLSENGAYKYAKFELRNTDSKIRRLTHLLRYGKITRAQNNTIVEFGNQVTLDNNGKTLKFLLVSKFESNPKKNRLSIESPLGIALLGKKVNDHINLKAPGGTSRYTITKIT